MSSPTKWLPNGAVFFLFCSALSNCRYFDIDSLQIATRNSILHAQLAYLAGLSVLFGNEVVACGLQPPGGAAASFAFPRSRRR